MTGLGKLVARLLIALLAPISAAAFAQVPEFSFGVIAHQARASDDASLRSIITDTDNENLAFVVAQGIKAGNEACSDSVYRARKDILDAAKNGVIISIAASDWTDCRNSRGRSLAIERLNRIREMFFGDDFSLGANRIPVVHQSTNPKFHGYAENVHWSVDDIQFATVNLPANNNDYRTEAGRNSEFEDRLIATREWLQRVFALATYKKMEAVVLFTDGDPMIEPGMLQKLGLTGKRDGFAEVRKLIRDHVRKFHGRVLIIDAGVPAGGRREAIAWHGRLGAVSVKSGLLKIRVTPHAGKLFQIVPAESSS